MSPRDAACAGWHFEKQRFWGDLGKQTTGKNRHKRCTGNATPNPLTNSRRVISAVDSVKRRTRVHARPLSFAAFSVAGPTSNFGDLEMIVVRMLDTQARQNRVACYWKLPSQSLSIGPAHLIPRAHPVGAPGSSDTCALIP